MILRRLLPTAAWLLAGSLSASAALAQPDRAHERGSLRGVPVFTVAVDVEAGLALIEEEALDVERLQQSITARLREAGLPVLQEESGRPDGSSYLYLHLNALNAGRGLVPFGIRVAFYQETSLARARPQTVTASTWETGLVGLVSSDQLSVIPESALLLLEEFIEDFQQVNPK